MITRQLQNEKERQGHFTCSLAVLFRFDRLIALKLCLPFKKAKKRLFS